MERLESQGGLTLPAKKGSGSMDWLGRWDTQTAPATRGRQQPAVVVARIRNLASMLLSCFLRRLRTDWHRQYGVEPWLVETPVDRQRLYVGCYRAAKGLVDGNKTRIRELRRMACKNNFNLTIIVDIIHPPRHASL